MGHLLPFGKFYCKYIKSLQFLPVRGFFWALRLVQHSWDYAASGFFEMIMFVFLAILVSCSVYDAVECDVYSDMCQATEILECEYDEDGEV